MQVSGRILQLLPFVRPKRLEKSRDRYTHIYIYIYIVVVQNPCPQNGHNVSVFGWNPLLRKCIPNGPFCTRTFRTTPIYAYVYGSQRIFTLAYPTMTRKCIDWTAVRPPVRICCTGLGFRGLVYNPNITSIIPIYPL